MSSLEESIDKEDPVGFNYVFAERLELEILGL